MWLTLPVRLAPNLLIFPSSFTKNCIIQLFDVSLQKYYKMNCTRLFCFLCVFLFAKTPLFCQEEKSISTAFPFLILNSDAISAGKGEVGVASSPDVFSQRVNASKYIFLPTSSAVAINYMPFTHRAVRDVFLGGITFYKKRIRDAFGANFSYFSIGDVNLTQDIGQQSYMLGTFKPTELSLEGSYSLQLSQSFAMGVTSRFLSSQLSIPSQGKSVARALAFDIAGYFYSQEHFISSLLYRYTWGFQLSNVGTKVKYDDLGRSFYLPTQLQTDSYNEWELSIEAQKYLVPTPNEQGVPDKDIIEALITSFYDAPNGFREEFHEINWAVGLEYKYNQSFFLRSGFFYQHKDKGDRKFLSIGAGFAFNNWQMDVAYPFSFSTYNNPFNTFKINLIYRFGQQ